MAQKLSCHHFTNFWIWNSILLTWHCVLLLFHIIFIESYTLEYNLKYITETLLKDWTWNLQFSGRDMLKNPICKHIL